MARGIVLCFALLLTVFEYGSCLKCYQCNTQANGNDCGDKPNEKFLVDCPGVSNYNNLNHLAELFPLLGQGGKNSYCVAFTTVSATSPTTARTCMTADTLSSPMDACKTEINSKKMKSCLVCEKDKCNGSSAISASFPIALLALVATYLSYKQ